MKNNELHIERFSTAENQLLKGFNSRNSSSFGEVYLLYSKHFYLYTSLLYKETEIEAEDIINDIFVNLWKSKIQFETLNNLKSYIYHSIKNSYKNYIIHKERFNHFTEGYSQDTDSSYDSDIIEVELYSKVDSILSLLNKEYATVIRLFINGYQLGEIAKLVNKPEQIVYNIKFRALNTLRKKLSKKDYSLILLILG